jgi:putative DNA primase/helicase
LLSKPPSGSKAERGGADEHKRKGRRTNAGQQINPSTNHIKQPLPPRGAGGAGVNGIHSTIDQFISAMTADGIEPHDRGAIVPDGRLHRFRVRGDRAGSLNGWAVLHPGAAPAGAYGSWQAGLSRVWAARTASALNPIELAERRRQIEQSRRQAEAGRQRLQAEAAKRALEFWRASVPAGCGHPYLAKKGIEPHCARLFGDRLVIPVISLESGQLKSLQFVSPGGEKRFLRHGAIAGNCLPIHIDGSERVLLAEGFASAATLAQLDASATVMGAGSAGNLRPAAQAIKRRWPGCRLTIVADADPVGVAKATEAAEASGAKLIIPPLSADEVACGVSDANDLVRLHGIAAVAAVLEVRHG